MSDPHRLVGDSPGTDGHLDGERLRAALHHSAGLRAPHARGADVDAILARVHRGSRRRRVRRTAGAVVVAAATLSVVAAGITSMAELGASPDVPVAGTPPVTSPAAAVYEIDVTEESVWALGSRDCGRTRYCPVVARSTDGGATWDTDYPRTADGARAIPVVRHLAVSDSGADVLVAGNGLAASHDAGETWQQIEAVEGSEVTGVAVGADEALAAVDAPGAASLLTSPAGADEWTPAAVAVGVGERLESPFAAGDLVGATVVSGGLSTTDALVARDTGDDGGWTRADTPCRTRTPLVTTDGSAIWYLCYANAGSVLATSSDLTEQAGDPSWTTTQLPGARSAGLGAWDDGTAVVATDERVFSVDAEGRVDELTGEPGSGLRLARDDYSYRATADQWLASFRGRLLHTTDGGQTWVEAHTP